MAIRSINRGTFCQLLPSHSVLETIIGDGVDWFADDREQTIGTVATKRPGLDWNFALLRRDQTNQFRALGLESHLPSRQAAKTMLLAAMEMAARAPHA